MNETINICRVDYQDANHCRDLKSLLNSYAIDIMGGGEAIAADALNELPGRLAEFPTAFSLLVYVDDQPAGLANCFFGFSTFCAKPLVNIHDLVIHPDFRGRGLSKQLMQSIEAIAHEKGCCKMTLEVLTNNNVALKLYEAIGFQSYELNPESGHAVFLEKKL